jgi:hypothetical protein
MGVDLHLLHLEGPLLEVVRCLEGLLGVWFLAVHRMVRRSRSISEHHAA